MTEEEVANESADGITMAELYALMFPDGKIPESSIEEDMAQTITPEEYAKVKPPRMSIERVHAVICTGPACGIVGIRNTKEQAETLYATHRNNHIKHNRAVLRVLQEAQSAREGQAGKSAPMPIAGNGVLDWQYGSMTTGLDPEKMWHVGCFGEVTPGPLGILHCTKCEAIDAPMASDEPKAVTGE